MIGIRCDYFACTFPPGETFTVVDWLEEIVGGEAVECTAAKGFNQACRIGDAYVNFRGSLDALKRPSYDTTMPGYLSMSGRCVGNMDWDALALLWCRLRGIQATCTRIDPCLDDFDKRVDFAGLFQAAERGEFGPMRKHLPMGDSVTGQSMTFGLAGKLGGGTVVQIYDKNKQSGGEIDSHRIEARFWKVRGLAHQVWLDLFPYDPNLDIPPPTHQEFCRVAQRIIAGSLSLPTCPWFKQIVGDHPKYTGARVRDPPDATMKKALQWLETIAGPMLTALFLHYENKGAAREFWLALSGIIVRSRDRMKKHHLEIAGKPRDQHAPEFVETLEFI